MDELSYWKMIAGKWKRAYWSTFDDTDEEKKEILKKAQERAKAKAKALRKNKKTSSVKKTTGKKKTVAKKTKAKTGDLFGLF